MNTMTLLLAVLALSHHSLGVQLECYACMGYDSNALESSLLNNRNCPPGSFDENALSTVFTDPTSNPQCFRLTYTYPDGLAITVRYAATVRSGSQTGPTLNYTRELIARGLTTKDITTVNGYFCNSNLCNASSLPTIFLPAVLLLLGLTRLLA